MRNTEEVINQILDIKGVKRVETSDENSLLVVLKKSPEKKLIKKAIKKGFVEFPHQWEGLKVRPICTNLKYMDGGDQSWLIDTDTNNAIWTSLEGWASILKEPKSLKPEDLVDGEIYRLKGKTHEFIYRFSEEDTEGIRVYTSCCKSDNDYSVGGFFDRNKNTFTATDNEKKALILAEVANGYFHELK